MLQKVNFKSLLVNISQVTWKFYKAMNSHSSLFSVSDSLSLSNKCAEVSHYAFGFYFSDNDTEHHLATFGC